MYKCKKFNYVNIDFETVWEFSKQVDVVESAEADYKKNEKGLYIHIFGCLFQIWQVNKLVSRQLGWKNGSFSFGCAHKCKKM